MDDDLQIDFVEVEIDLEHGWREDLFITLTSPEGTESVLMDRPNVSGGRLVFTFSSSQFWGENSEGSWDLTVYDDNWNGYYGGLNTWKLKLYGDTDTSSDTYIYTNEFANYTTTSRRTLTDSSGTDTINAAAITSNTSLNLTPGSFSTLAGNSLTISSSTTIEKAFTGDGNDSIIGNSASNNLNGGRGNDTIDGGAGNDSMVGGVGNDLYGVDNPGDLIVELANQGIDTVNSAITYTLGTNLENLTLTGTANINGTGNTLNNVITGNSNNNRLDGGDGNDTLIGGAGNDTLSGGNGNDSMVGGAGNDLSGVTETTDKVVEAFNGGTDSVNSRITYTLTSNVENLTLTGTANINGTGNTLNNVITGNSGNNILTGGTGNDTLTGGGGNDTLIGGTGNDFFRFNSSVLQLGLTKVCFSAIS